MGGCCCGKEEEEDARSFSSGTAQKGPVVERRCTDVCWLLLFLVHCGAFLAVVYEVSANSNTNRLWHGKDHSGEICLGAKAKTYYPRLHLDLAEDRTLRKRYGVCVDACPTQGSTVRDEAARRDWFVPLPQLEIANRCVPYAKVELENGTAMCAWPGCERDFPKTQEPERPEQVCGLEMDGTAGYWPLGAPDKWLLLGWKQDGVPAAVIEKRVRLLAKKGHEAKGRCEVVVRKDISFTMGQSDEGVTYELLTQLTGVLFRQARMLYLHLTLILALGLGASLVLSMVIITFFPCCMKGMLIIMLALLFALLIAVDYILFVQANLADGRMARYVAGLLDKSGVAGAMDNGLGVIGVDANMGRLSRLAGQANADAEMHSIYQWTALGLAVVIFLLLCLVMAIRQNFTLLFALYKAAARAIREMPSLLLLPFWTLMSLAIWTAILLYTVLGSLSLDEDVLVEMLRKTGLEDADEPQRVIQAKKALLWWLLFSFLWIYFFHLAIFQVTLAGAISKWYFYRKDTSQNAGTGRHSDGWFFGRPLILAYHRTLRYHLGSAAAGSLLLALFTIPRLVLEYVDQETKKLQAGNPVLRVAVPCTRCCLACFDRFLKCLTEYAYINVAVSGKGFCRGAIASGRLLANHPVQVALDRVASASLQTVACLLVPFGMVAVTYVLGKSSLVVSSFVFFLSFMVTRMCIGVFDICISALMVCAMEDKDKYGGKYAPSELRGPMGLPPRQSTAAGEPSIEMSFTHESG